jgi:DNA-binding HxlR family transcriptional regulator
MVRTGKARTRLSAIEVLSLRGSAKILLALRKQDSMNYSELAKIVGFETTATRALKALEAGKYLTREVLNKPYRPVAYSLTERGKRLSEIVVELERL